VSQCDAIITTVLFWIIIPFTLKNTVFVSEMSRPHLPTAGYSRHDDHRCLWRSRL